MSRALLTVGAVFMLSIVASCTGSDTTRPQAASRPATSDLNKAVSIALAELSDLGKPQDEYKLVSAQQILLKGKYVWHVTFKLAKSLPADPATQAIGAGGEIFINVDLNTGETVVTYGE